MGQFPFLQLRQVWALPVLLRAPCGSRQGVSFAGPSTPHQWGTPMGHSHPWDVPDGAGRWDNGKIPVLGATGCPCVTLMLYELPCS